MTGHAADEVSVENSVVLSLPFAAFPRCYFFSAGRSLMKRIATTAFRCFSPPFTPFTVVLLLRSQTNHPELRRLRERLYKKLHKNEEAAAEGALAAEAEDRLEISAGLHHGTFPRHPEPTHQPLKTHPGCQSIFPPVVFRRGVLVE